MIGFSPSTLNAFHNCPRCFWWDKAKGIKQPDGIKASLPKAMDRMMKQFVEGHAVSGTVPPWLAGVPSGAGPFKDRDLLKKFMHWQSCKTKIQIGSIVVEVRGEMDDIIEHSDGTFSPWDFKTKGSEPADDYGAKYYQRQLDTYHLLLEAHSMKCTGKGYLSFGWPMGIREDLSMVWAWKNLVLDTDPGRAVVLVQKAIACLRGPEPEASVTCDFCTFADGRAAQDRR